MPWKGSIDHNLWESPALSAEQLHYAAADALAVFQIVQLAESSASAAAAAWTRMVTGKSLGKKKKKGQRVPARANLRCGHTAKPPVACTFAFQHLPCVFAPFVG